MADCNYVLEGWDWENIFTSSLIEHDLPWNGELSEPDSMNVAVTALLASNHPSSFPSSVIPEEFANDHLSEKLGQQMEVYGTPVDSSAGIATNTSDGSLNSINYNQDTPVSSHQLPLSETSLINAPTANLSKKKKRDPRLECPNFVAGRIPCSCPEEDEMEDDMEVVTLVKKRSKVGARCQVPSCGEDISHLKGYHQRHRVCLECANLPKVMLKDQPHRYCQQCGKFHRLSDFDEGKRSCRRKLERHNKRRRRHPVEEGGEAQDCKADLLTIDIDCSNLHLSPEGAATENVHTADTAIERKTGKATARAKSNTKGPLTIEERDTSSQCLRGSETLSIASDILQRGEDTLQKGLTDDRRSEDSSGSVRRVDKDIVSVNKGKLDEHCLPSAPRGDTNQQVGECVRSKKPPSKSESPTMLTSHWRCTDYVSLCPTGRISFKLYDWNPADFPRRLRQQIFEWLANMPVELESYVRSGCIILTFFATMPQPMWDKLLAEWKERVQTFIPKSGIKILGTGQVTTRRVEKSLCLKNGKATSGCCKDICAPVLVDLYPRSLEAGRTTKLHVFGYNLSGGRLFLSFGQQYVQCTALESVESSDFSVYNIGERFLNKVEVQKVTIFLPEEDVIGLAFVEVENTHGLSNFMPILVADKSVCLEINNNAKSFRSQFSMDMLADLGWTLKYMNKYHAIEKVEVKEALARRLEKLLLFTLEHGCHAIAYCLVQTSIKKFLKLSGDDWSIFNSSKDLSGIRRGKLHSHRKWTEEGHFLPRLAMDADSTHTIHQPSQAKGVHGPTPAIERILSSQSISIEDAIRSSFWPVEVPLLDEMVPLLEDGSGHKGNWAWSLSWHRKPKAPTGTSFLRTSHKRFKQILVVTVGIVMVCTGMCVILQHPHEVTEISMSLRRCLWGSSNPSHV